MQIKIRRLCSTTASFTCVGYKSANTTTDAEYPAAIQGTVDVEIRPQVSGNLERVFVDEGAYVSKGQTLFKINERPYP